MEFDALVEACSPAPSEAAQRRARLVWDLGGAGRDTLRQTPNDVSACESLPDPTQWQTGLALPALHTLRRQSMIALASFELSGEATLPDVADQQSQLADWILDQALELAVEQTGGARFAILALGKLGGYELNYSSDVDLVFVRGDDVPLAQARKTARVFVDLLHRRTPTGGLYRVDMRLRPHGKLGELVPSRASVVRYMETQSRAWERQAWVKARAAAGDRALGQRVLDDLRGWLWEQTLGAEDLSHLLGLRERMAASSPNPERDVKVGPGGIRDVEFAVQLNQLLHGRDPRLRVTATLDGILGLAAANVLRPEEAHVLEEGYLFHRRLEHVLQLYGDREVTVLPTGDALEPLAAALGRSVEDLEQELLEQQTRVRGALDTLIRRPFAAHADPDAAELRDLILAERPSPDVVRALLGGRFADPAAAHAHLLDLSRERSFLLAPSGRAKVVLAGLVPTLLDAIAAQRDPDRTLRNLRAVLEPLGAKATVYELWSEQPDALELLVALAAGSDVLSALLARHPGVFDEVIDRLLTRAVVRRDDVTREVGHALEGAAPGPGQLEVWTLYQLQVGMADLAGHSNLQNTARRLADVASGFLEGWLSHARAAAREAHGDPPGFEISLIALGKLGAHELCYGSDTDLLAVYDASGPAPDGTSVGVFAEGIVRRLLSQAAAVPWGDAPPLELDFRLRPGGSSSPLAQRLSAVVSYYRGDGPGPGAHDFERLALQKARAVAGSLPWGAGVVAQLRQAIRGATGAALGAEVARMRTLQEEAAVAHDLKRGRGSLADVELMVSALALTHLPAEDDEPNTLRALGVLVSKGVVAAQAGLDLQTGYAFLRRVELRLRIHRFDARPLLPTQAHAQRRLALSLGYHDTQLPAEQAFLQELTYHRDQLARRSNELRCVHLQP